MFRRILALMFLSILVVVAPRGSSQRDRPDLVPVPDPRPGYKFCRRDASQKLQVTVKNQNNNDVAAHASTTKVEFTPGGTIEIPTPAIPAGVSVDLPPVVIPAQCFNPDCEFTITVDSQHQVHESNEGNNTGIGKCLG